MATRNGLVFDSNGKLKEAWDDSLHAKAIGVGVVDGVTSNPLLEREAGPSPSSDAPLGSLRIKQGTADLGGEHFIKERAGSGNWGNVQTQRHRRNIFMFMGA